MRSLLNHWCGGVVIIGTTWRHILKLLKYIWCTLTREYYVVVKNYVAREKLITRGNVCNIAPVWQQWRWGTDPRKHSKWQPPCGCRREHCDTGHGLGFWSLRGGLAEVHVHIKGGTESSAGSHGDYVKLSITFLEFFLSSGNFPHCECLLPKLETLRTNFPCLPCNCNTVMWPGLCRS